MSADLLGLDDFYQQQSEGNSQNENGPQFLGASSSLQKSLNPDFATQGLQAGVTLNQQDDDWGAFESADPADQPREHPATVLPIEQSVHSQWLETNSPKETTHPGQDYSGWQQSPEEPWDFHHTNYAQTQEAHSTAEVLFDADEITNEDFGDFESADVVEPERKLNQDLLGDLEAGNVWATTQSTFESHVASPSGQNLSLIDVPEISTAPQPSKGVSNQLGTRPLKTPQAPPKPKLSETDDDWGDDWDNFESQVMTPKKSTIKRSQPSQTQPVTTTTTSRSINQSLSTQSVSRPTNIPPPSVLLSLLGTLLSKPLVSGPQSSQSAVDHLILAVVAGRLIAGRAFRWKRDTLLSQGMRIGPAHSGKSGGMKLAGVDKTEKLREEKEVTDVLRIWRQQIGRLRSTLGTVHSGQGGVPGGVPELSDTLHVKTAKQEEGAFKAPQPCALCGLKRDERIDKVDYQVEDSFGEWWIDYWGHKACFDFWEGYKDELKQR